MKVIDPCENRVLCDCLPPERSSDESNGAAPDFSLKDAPSSCLFPSCF